MSENMELVNKARKKITYAATRIKKATETLDFFHNEIKNMSADLNELLKRLDQVPEAVQSNDITKPTREVGDLISLINARSFSSVLKLTLSGNNEAVLYLSDRNKMEFIIYKGRTPGLAGFLNGYYTCIVLQGKWPLDNPKIDSEIWVHRDDVPSPIGDHTVIKGEWDLEKLEQYGRVDPNKDHGPTAIAEPYRKNDSQPKAVFQHVERDAAFGDWSNTDNMQSPKTDDQQ